MFTKKEWGTYSEREGKMIGTTPKPFEEIKNALEGYEKLAVIGCDGCAKVCMTGGSDQVVEMAEKLKEKGKNVVLALSPERTVCGQTRPRWIRIWTELEQSAQAVLVLSDASAPYRLPARC